jgi:hypothetical protein
MLGNRQHTLGLDPGADDPSDLSREQRVLAQVLAGPAS